MKTVSLLGLFACLINSCTTSSFDPHPVSIELSYDDHGDPAGCSWYCGAPPISVKSSSTLKQDPHDFSASNLHDMNKMSAWVEGSDGYGIGEKVTFTFDLSERNDEAMTVRYASIINGLSKSKLLWKQNSRVKTLNVHSPGLSPYLVQLADSDSPQDIDLQEVKLKPKSKTKITFEIVEVYPGTHFQDTALSDFKFNGGGVH